MKTTFIKPRIKWLLSDNNSFKEKCISKNDLFKQYKRSKVAKCYEIFGIGYLGEKSKDGKKQINWNEFYKSLVEEKVIEEVFSVPLYKGDYMKIDVILLKYNNIDIKDKLKKVVDRKEQVLNFG